MYFLNLGQSEPDRERQRKRISFARLHLYQVHVSHLRWVFFRSY